MTPEEAWAKRVAMVTEQIAARGVTNPEVLAAMRTVPRELFVPACKEAVAYRDRPVAIGGSPGGPKQTISQPYVVGLMLELLNVSAGDRVLEVGAGSGYVAALLAELCSEVYAVERIESLASAARERLGRLAYRTVSIIHGDGALGWPEKAPFDGIIVSCGATSVPPPLLDQLAAGRRLVIPTGKPGAVMELVVWTDGTCESHGEVRFVPLLDGVC